MHKSFWSLLFCGTYVLSIPPVYESPAHEIFYAIKNHDRDLLKNLLAHHKEHAFDGQKSVMPESSEYWPSRKRLNLVNAAAFYHDVSALEVLQQHGAQLCKKTSGYNELHYALCNQDASPELVRATCEFLIRLGVCVKQSSRHGSPLHCAVRLPNGSKVCQLLIDHGADIHAWYSPSPWLAYFMTPLHCAAHRGNTETCRMLVHNGAHVEPDTRECVQTPLMEAVCQGHYETAQFLLEHAARPDAMTIGGFTPLISIIVGDRLEQEIREKLLRLLLRYGADPLYKVVPEAPSPLSLSRKNPVFMQIILEHLTKNSQHKVTTVCAWEGRLRKRKTH